jgi:hypothetical protein
MVAKNQDEAEKQGFATEERVAQAALGYGSGLVQGKICNGQGEVQGVRAGRLCADDGDRRRVYETWTGQSRVVASAARRLEMFPTAHIIQAAGTATSLLVVALDIFPYWSIAAADAASHPQLRSCVIFTS